MTIEERVAFLEIAVERLLKIVEDQFVIIKEIRASQREPIK